MGVKILIAGGTCSGKSTLARYIADHTGYPILSVGKCLWSYAQEIGHPISPESLQNLGLGLITQLNHDGFLQWIMSRTPTIKQEDSFIIDGVRQVEMYESSQRTFSRSMLVYCACDRETQITRLVERDKISRDDAERILSLFVEQSVVALKPLANIIFQPGDSVNEFLSFEKVEIVISRYLKNHFLIRFASSARASSSARL